MVSVLDGHNQLKGAVYLLTLVNSTLQDKFPFIGSDFVAFDDTGIMPGIYLVIVGLSDDLAVNGFYWTHGGGIKCHNGQ